MPAAVFTVTARSNFTVTSINRRGGYHRTGPATALKLTARICGAAAGSLSTPPGAVPAATGD